jgi:hypothetical protein
LVSSCSKWEMRRMPNNGAAGLLFHELKKFLKTCSSSHIFVLDTHKAMAFILKSCGCYVTRHGCSTHKSLVIIVLGFKGTVDRQARYLCHDNLTDDISISICICTRLWGNVWA